MSKILLRSGYINNFLALGENGQTIFDSARQIRETLRLRKQTMLADCLAIPQLNDGGDKVDWYAPLAGKVITWASADEKLRLQALRYLDNCLLTASQLSERSLASPKNTEQFFGSLLQHALRFPGSQHVYLVDEKPVLTFWGFIDLNMSTEGHALSCLYESMKPEPFATAVDSPPILPEPLIQIEAIEDPEPVIVTLSKPEETPSLAAPSASDELHEPLPAPRQSLWRKMLWPIISIVLFMSLLLSWPWLYPLVHPELNEPEAVETLVAEPPAAVKPVAAQILLSALPLQKATVIPQKVEEPKPEPPVSPPPKNALVLPAEAVKAGTTKFLNGSWRVSFDAGDAVTDIPIPTGMRFQIKNNIGQVRLVHSDNLVCRTELHSGLMQSGNLVIKPRLKVKAKCADGSRYAVPEIICSQGLTGAAQCNARFEDDVMVSVTVTRVGK